MRAARVNFERCAVVGSSAMSLRRATLGLGLLWAVQLAAGCSGSSADSEASGGAAESGGASASGGRDSGRGGALLAIGGIGSAGEPGLEECARTTAQAELVPANLLFVLDTSGSMACNPPDGDTELGARCARYPEQEDPSRPSKWQVTRETLRTALSGLSGRANLSLGLTLFPNGSECGVVSEPDVPIAPLDAAQLEAFDTVLDAVEPTGETPVAGATILSFAYLAEQLKSGTLQGNSFVILLTDGAETCAPSVLPQLVETDIPNARLFDIRTFVIGAPGSEAARGLLSTMAWEGGTAVSEDCDHANSNGSVGDCHFDMTRSENFEQELTQALAEIGKLQEISCVLDVPQNQDGGEVDLDRVNVTFTPEDGEPESVPSDARFGCNDGADGWQYTSDRSQILLCGEICRRVREQNGELSIVLGCPTEVVR